MSNCNVDCPICLDPMVESDIIYSLPCTTCNYNFCSKCVDTFVRSSEDDYAEASDGSHQVKVHIACPQCRSKYNIEIQQVLILRKAYHLGQIIFPPTKTTAEEEKKQQPNEEDHSPTPINDSLLTATELTSKQEFTRKAKQKSVVLAHGLYCKVLRGSFTSSQSADTSISNDYKNRESTLEQAKNVWERLFEAMPDEPNDLATDKENMADNKELSTKKSRPTPNYKLKPYLNPLVDATLFLGLDDCMTIDEQAFVTNLFTSGTEHGVTQGAMILHGVLQLATGQSTQSKNMSAKLSQKSLEQMEKMKKQFPLPNHMPGYFTIPAFTKSERFLQLVDDTWDGKIIPSKVSTKTFDKVYGDHLSSSNNTSHNVIIIQSVRGPAGRVGLRRADIITHINDIELRGENEKMTAKDVLEFIYDINSKNPSEEISITVNANHETAQFLQMRNKLVTKSKVELI